MTHYTRTKEDLIKKYNDISEKADVFVKSCSVLNLQGAEIFSKNYSSEM